MVCPRVPGYSLGLLEKFQAVAWDDPVFAHQEVASIGGAQITR